MESRTCLTARVKYLSEIAGAGPWELREWNEHPPYFSSRTKR